MGGGTVRGGEMQQQEKKCDRSQQAVTAIRRRRHIEGVCSLARYLMHTQNPYSIHLRIHTRVQASRAVVPLSFSLQSRLETVA